MSDTMTIMGKPRNKTATVRIDADLIQPVAFLAAAFGMTVPQYLTDRIRQVVRRDVVRAERLAKSIRRDDRATETEAEQEE